jgi:hypothetical protein
MGLTTDAFGGDSVGLLADEEDSHIGCIKSCRKCTRRFAEDEEDPQNNNHGMTPEQISGET